MGSTAQQYCLRWNNHRTNLLTVFDELLQNEAFTDVTLVCDGGSPIKCHRMVLAACSPYFQNLFTDLPCKHPVVVLKDVKYIEIKAILEYMYRGEVNVAQDQLAALLRVAEALKVKGLVEEKRAEQMQQQQLTREDIEPMDHSPSAITTSTSNLPAPVVHSSSNNSSPPHSTNGHFPRSNYAMYGKAPSMDRTAKMNLPMWAMPGMPPMPPHHQQPSPSPSSQQQQHLSSPVPAQQSHPHAAATAAAAAAMLTSCYESDMSHHHMRRKKMQGAMAAINRDTPILRTVLGQGQADSSQPVSLVCHPDSHADTVNSNSNGSVNIKSEKHIKNEPSEDAQSPYTDLSPIEDDKMMKMDLLSSSPQSYCGISSGIATYVPTQKPEWKRYKQYTRNDIMSAIEAVRNGMSALQSARKYGVPSRTLYDKVKKLGITTSRPFKRGSNGSSGVNFSFGVSGTSSPYGGHDLSESEENISMNNNSALLEASSFLQHALDTSRGSGEEREALAAMAAAAAAMSGHSSSTSPPNSGHGATSPSPMSKYMRQSSLTPSPAPGSEHNHSETNGSSERDREDDEDQVEDLSVGGGLRKQQQQQQLQQPVHESRVIMPPMNIASILKKEELLKESIMEDMRREVSVTADEVQ